MSSKSPSPAEPSLLPCPINFLLYSQSAVFCDSSTKVKTACPPTPEAQWDYLGLDKGTEDWHQHLVLHVVGILDGHIQDVDGLLSEALQGRNRGWGQEGGARARPSPTTLPIGLTLLSSSEYREVHGLLKRGVSTGTLAKQEMTSSKFL